MWTVHTPIDYPSPHITLHMAHTLSRVDLYLTPFVIRRATCCPKERQIIKFPLS